MISTQSVSTNACKSNNLFRILLAFKTKTLGNKLCLPVVILLVGLDSSVIVTGASSLVTGSSKNESVKLKGKEQFVQYHVSSEELNSLYNLWSIFTHLMYITGPRHMGGISLDMYRQGCLITTCACKRDA